MTAGRHMAAFGGGGTARRRLGPCLALAALALAAWPADAGAQEPPGLVPYVVEPGESCWSIARKLFGDPARYDILHRYNDLGPMPHLLAPGQVLMVPAEGTDPDARVGAPYRDVRARPPDSVDWAPAYDDMALWQLFRVATGDGASALVRFRDASGLRMREHALLVIHGGSARASRMQRDVRTTITLEKGTVRGGLARMDAEAAGLRVDTPAGRVDLRSTEAQVEVDAIARSVVSVYQGEADVSARGSRVTVPSDHGTSVRKGQAPRPARPLPPAPAWDGLPPRIDVVAAPGGTGAFEARWLPVPEAARYRVELARDRAFSRVFVDIVMGAGIRAFRADQLAPGTCWARVAAIDAEGLEGRPTPPLEAVVSPLRTARQVAVGDDGVIEGVGFAQLEMGDGGDALEWSVDGGPWQPAAAPVRLADAGVHRVVFRNPRTGWTHPVTVRILGVAGTFGLPAAPLRPGEPAAAGTLSVRDERGRPQALPGVAVRFGDGAPLPLVPVAPGAYRFDLAVPANATEPVRVLRADWALGALAVADVGVAVAPAPPPFVWPAAPPAVHWALQVPGMPARGGRAVSSIGASAFVAESPSRAGSRRVFVRADVRGELALLDGRLGIDVQVPWWQRAATDRAIDRSAMGDVVAGIRGVALDTGRVRLVPFAGFQAGTSRASRDDGMRLRVSPGLMAEFALAHAVTATVSQAVVFDAWTRGRVPVLWASSYGLGWRPFRMLELGVVLDVVAGFRGDALLDGVRALAAGGAVRLLWDRYRIGLVGGGPLTGGARDLAGGWTVGLAVDLGFRGPR